MTHEHSPTFIYNTDYTQNSYFGDMRVLETKSKVLSNKC